MLAEQPIDGRIVVKDKGVIGSAPPMYHQNVAKGFRYASSLASDMNEPRYQSVLAVYDVGIDPLVFHKVHAHGALRFHFCIGEISETDCGGHIWLLLRQVAWKGQGYIGKEWCQGRAVKLSELKDGKGKQQRDGHTALQ